MGYLAAPSQQQFSETVASQIPLKYPAYHLGFIGINLQLAIGTDCIGITFAPCHFGTAVLKSVPQTGFDGFALFKHIHGISI